MKTKKPLDNTDDIQQKLTEIGEKVRMYRRQINANYEIFALEHHINKVTLQRIESGKNYTMSSFIELMNKMDVSIEEFFSGSDTR